MAKYVYLSFIMMKPVANIETYANKIRPKLENKEVELVHDGTPYGVLEDWVLVHRTDLEIEDFSNFRAEAFTVDGTNWIDHARTIVTTTFKP